MTKSLYIKTLIIFLIVYNGVAAAAQTLLIQGKVVTEYNKALEFVNISIANTNIGTSSDFEGQFKLTTSKELPLKLQFSYLGYEPLDTILTKKTDLSALKITLKSMNHQLTSVQVTGDNRENHSFTRIDSKLVEALPDAGGGGIEGLVKTQMGVASNNELSSQYRVRGGNFDENLVYVNDIEIYRPFLTRSGQQEGLSFVNPEMVSSLNFSAGGFDAQYGDKMSSVLDIQYKKPQKIAASATVSFLGAGAHFENASKNKKFSTINGVRYKSNQTMISDGDVEGNYNPTFLDIQSYSIWKPSDKIEFGILGYLSQNKYQFVPENRETSFGTISEAKQLKIYFDGQEEDEFMTGFGAFSTKYKFNSSNNIQLIASAFQTHEFEAYDIESYYWLSSLEDVTAESTSEQGVKNLVGSGIIEHARNELYANVYNIALRGEHKQFNNTISWEVKYQKEHFNDLLDEFELRDSAGYSIPYHGDALKLHYAYNADIDIASNRITSFIQNNHQFEIGDALMNVTTGVRLNYWDFNDELLISPRISLMYEPTWANQYRFRASGGLYYQSPLYKELRTPEGIINYDIQAQQSIHLVLGMDRLFTIWDRPFKFSTELYYKEMKNLIPYQIDNVRIKYLGSNNANGYAKGIDMKINGEFVEGVESWASISWMKSEEDLTNDTYPDGSEPGFIPRPSDQRLNFSLFFQDYLRNNPSFKVNINLLYGTGLPFGPPNSERYLSTNRMPAYRRVDMGFSKELTGTQKNPQKKAGLVKKLWIGLEIFNIFDINNTISYFWVTDIYNKQYAVPNYLTSRRVNLKLTGRF